MFISIIISVRHLLDTKRLRGICLLLVFLLPGNASVVAQVEQDIAEETRVLYPSEWGAPDPVGLAYATASGHLFILDKGNTEPSATNSIVTVITPDEDPVGNVQIDFTVDEATNIAFDDDGQRLFLLNGEDAELAQVDVDENGGLIPAALMRFDVASLGLNNVQGMAVDAANQRLLLLDSGALQVLSVALDDENDFDSANVVRIDLAHLQATDLRGIAVHPTTQHLYVASQATRQLYELTESGQWLASYALAGLDLNYSGGFVFAPSADLTDPSDTMHLFITDSGQADPVMYGKIVEAALVCQLCVPSATNDASAGTLVYLPFIASSAGSDGPVVRGADSVSLAFAPEADARVLQSNPDTNYGTISRLDVDSPGEESYIRFSVTGVTGVIQSATLRLFVRNGSSNGPSLYQTDNSWAETGITWNNRPPPATSGALADVGAVVAGTWAEYNLTGQVVGDGVYNFVFLPDSTDGIRYDAREGGTPPELVITFDSGPVSTPTNTAIPPTNTPVPPTNTPVPPTNTSVPPTNTAVPPTNTSVPPTNTAVPPTNTPVPPTNTSVPLTNTAVPPTNTPVPPTNTPALPTNTPAAPTNTPVTGSLTIGAAADARVLQSNPDTNYGTLSRLDVDSPGEESYIRFSVSGATGAVQSATLRLFVGNGSSNGPSLYQTDNSWVESGITWNNRPLATSSAIADVGAIVANTWAEYNLTSQVTGNGIYNFVFLPDSTDGTKFDSREGSNPPQLVLTFNSGPTPTPTIALPPTNTPLPTNTPTPGPSPTPTNTPVVSSEIFVGAGDIADCSRTTDDATALLLDNIPGTVFTIGDNAYPNGTSANYNNCYEPTWGRHKARTHPAIGDNEYNTAGAVPYFTYFGAAAGNPNEGYYSYDVGSWHIITLNSNCSQIGGCGPNSAQGQWLQADLAAHLNTCILAIHHEPLFSSKGGDADLRDFWVPLYAAGADIVLSGHRHNYERFTQQNPDGAADPGRGIRQMVVGTGGVSLSSFNAGIAPNSEVRNDSAHGVLKLTLHPTSYDWEFVPIAGQTFTDSGSTNCVTP